MAKKKESCEEESLRDILLRYLTASNEQSWELFQTLWQKDQKYWSKNHTFALMIYLFLKKKGYLGVRTGVEFSEERIIRRVEDGKMYSIVNFTPEDEVIYALVPEIKKYITSNERITARYYKPGQELSACRSLDNIDRDFVNKHYYSFLENSFLSHPNFSINRVDDEREVLWSYKNNREFSRFIIDYFGMQGGRIFNPHAGLGYLQYCLPEESDICSFTSNKELELLSMLFHDGKYVRYDVNMKERAGGATFDYIVWNPLADGMSYIDLAKEYDDLYDMINNNLADDGKAAIVTTNHLWYRSLDYGLDFDVTDKFVKCQFLDTIIFVDKGLSVALFDKQKQGDSIKIIDMTSVSELSAEVMLDEIHRESDDMYIINQEDVEAMDGYIDLEALKRKKLYCSEQKGFKLVSLKNLLEVYGGESYVGLNDKYSIEKVTLGNDYSPIDSYVSAKDGKCYTFSSCCSYINEEVLLINSFERADEFKPTLFCPSQGGAIFDFFVGYIYRIKDQVVDKRYLINEMRKSYFLEQLYPCGRKLYTYNHHDYVNPMFLDLKVYIPDVENTSLERQRQLLREEKELEVELMVRRFNIDPEDSQKTKLRIGAELKDGEYKITAFLASGGFGQTYKAKQGEKVVAIKEFFCKKTQHRGSNGKEVITAFGKHDETQKVKAKFRKEAQKAQEFTHPNIIKVYEMFDENNTCYYSMEYIDGCDLAAYCKKHGGALSVDESKAIIRQIASALKELHAKQYNHHDVKPGNILIDAKGRAILIDFGTVHKFDFAYEDEIDSITPRNDSTILQVHTPGYLPKYAYETGKFHAGVDIYSLGATLYYMLTGGLSPRNVNISKKTVPRLPDKAWNVIKTAMQNDPDKALKSVDEFLALLEGI